MPPFLGSSQHLLNRDHAATYYAGMPRCLPPLRPPLPSAAGTVATASAAEDGADRGDGPPSGLAGRRLRRHGDEFARLPGGYYQALGRADDTMNLGGIKVSSAELERCVLERLPHLVSEAAAVGAPSPGGGPERLVLFVVPAPPPPPSGAPSAPPGAAFAAPRRTAPPAAAGERGEDADADAAPSPLLQACRAAVREGLNPLFRVAAVVMVAALPRTASGKVVRRSLRERATGAAAGPGRARL